MPKHTKTKPAAKQPELPHLVSETPEMHYMLLANDDDGDRIVDALQQISLSRSEYRTLKEHLNRVRGFIAQLEAAHA
jgi:hypothetical protein